MRAVDAHGLEESPVCQDCQDMEGLGLSDRVSGPLLFESATFEKIDYRTRAWKCQLLFTVVST